jgi:hypothetical protein
VGRIPAIGSSEDEVLKPIKALIISFAFKIALEVFVFIAGTIVVKPVAIIAVKKRRRTLLSPEQSLFTL